MITLKEVAKLADVSPSAVSRYLNGGSLSDAKALRIREAIEQTGYEPNKAAQTLRTGTINQIGIIVPEIDSTSVGQVVAGINSKLQTQNYLPLLGSTDLQDDMEIRYLEIMQANHVAGIILMGTSLTPAKSDVFKSCKVPLVITGQNFPGMPCVHHDDYNAMRELGQLMTARGRRHFVYIGTDERDVASGLSRRQGAQTALSEAGLDPASMRCTLASYTAESGYAVMTALLREIPNVDAVLCATDKIAHGAMQALKDAGKRIPLDVSIAGVGNSWADTVSTPKITTAQLYHYNCGVDAATIILEMIERKNQPGPVRQVKLGYSIMDRESI